MSARDELLKLSRHTADYHLDYDYPGLSNEEVVDRLLSAYALELAELIQDPERWERFALKENSMRVYMSTAKKVARIIELEVESHGQP